MTDLDFDTALEDGAVRPGSHFAQRASADAEAARALAGAVLRQFPIGAADGEDDAAWAALGLVDQAEESIDLPGGDFDVPAISAAEMLETDAYEDAWVPTAPQAVITPRNRGWMWGVAATLLLGVGAFAAFLAMPDDDDGARFLAPSSVASAASAASASPTTTAAIAAPASAAAIRAAGDAPESAAPASAAPASIAAAPTTATLAKPKATRRSRRTPSRRKPSAAAEDKPALAAAPKAAAKKPVPAPRKATAEVDSLLDGLGSGGKPARRAPGRPAAAVLNDPTLPDKLSKAQILRVVRSNASKVSACKRAGASGTVKVVMVIGRSGRVTSASPGGTFAGTPAGVCVAAKVRTFRFPQFSGDPMRINMPFRL